jgi:hypothetical protein
MRFYQQVGSGQNQSADSEVVHAFFVWLIDSEYVARAEEGRGLLRPFLLAAFKQFLSRQHHYQSSSNRISVNAFVSIRSFAIDTHVDVEPSPRTLSETSYDYHWAVALVDRALHRLGEEWAGEGRSEHFQALRRYLAGNRDLRAGEIAKKLGMTEGAFRVAILCLRRRYAELLRQEVRFTTRSDADAKTELRYLLETLRGQ